MTIIQSGTQNLNALVVPDLYVDIISPTVVNLNGVPTNVIGLVGTASWGPKNLSTNIGNYAQFVNAFGPVMNRSYDLGTYVACAIAQGANNIECVRVTDGTDVAASVTVLSTCLTITSIYTGSYGNNCVVSIGPGSTTGTSKAIVSMPGWPSEVFDNITGSGNTLWTNMANAINNGQNALRGPSKLITATAGAGTTGGPSILTQYPLTSGTDGVTTITSAVLMGVNTSPSTGIYALQNQGVSIGMVADMVDVTQWSTLASMGLANGILWVVSTAAASTIAADVTALSTSGAASPNLWFLHGDYIYWNDPVNQITRLVSPVPFGAGRLANLSPEQSPLNKPVYGVAATQKTSSGAAQAAYSSSELTTLFTAGIDVITNPCPGGNYFGARLGHNTSPSVASNGINYTRLTNYIAASLQSGMGQYIGQPINPTLFQNVTSTLNNFLANMLGLGLLGYQTNGALPYTVVCNASNNPFSQTSIGILQANVTVQYMGINEKFIINVQGGQGVTIATSSTPYVA